MVDKATMGQFLQVLRSFPNNYQSTHASDSFIYYPRDRPSTNRGQQYLKAIRLPPPTTINQKNCNYFVVTGNLMPKMEHFCICCASAIASNIWRWVIPLRVFFDSSVSLRIASGLCTNCILSIAPAISTHFHIIILPCSNIQKQQ